MSAAQAHIMSATELAALFGISTRRVTQYRDGGLLPTIERGRFDGGWLAHVRTGEKITQNARQKPHRDTLVAIGWLAGVGAEPTPEDLDAFAKLFERNGLSRDQAMLALGRAHHH